MIKAIIHAKPTLKKLNVTIFSMVQKKLFTKELLKIQLNIYKRINTHF